ncbi:putative gustatory receptor 28b [Argopecten irradians]|uniref:putative gustatory receptor 28b n=1 Tax=Argopecten irradians TaxID=31199 RepID=UPI00372023FD
MPSRKISVTTVGMISGLESSKMSWGSEHSNDKLTPQEVKRSNCLVSALRPLLLSMSLVGLFDIWKIQKYGQEPRAHRRAFFKLYQIFIICLFVFNLIRFFFAFQSFEFGSELLATVLLQTWFMLCTSYALICYKMIENPTALIRFFTQWQKYWSLVRDLTGECSKEQACSWKRIRKYASVATVIGWSIVIGNVGFCSYTIITGTAFTNMLDPFSRSHYLFPLTLSIFHVIILYLSCAWSFITAFMIVLILSLYQEFKHFAERLENLTHDKPIPEVQENLEAMRVEHNALCNMIDTADGVLKHLVGLCLVVHVFITLILIYNICWYEVIRTDIGQLVSHIFWLSGNSSMLIAMMAVCCMVNIQAHEPAKFIHNLSMKEITAEFALQVNVFLHRLNGAPIGITAWSLFVIDNQVVVSVAGMIATYFVVLLQFQQASTTTNSSVNGTVV